MTLIGLGAGLGSGANSLISRKIGAKDKKEANNVATHSVILIIILTIIIIVVCTLFLDNILYMLGAAKVMVYARSYGFFIILGIFSILISNLLAAILHSEGSIKKATYPFIVAAFANMIINPIFIYTLDCGVAGAAIGVMVCQTIFCLIPLIYWIFIEKSTYIQVSFKDYKSDFSIVKQILNVGIPASLEEIIMAILTALINGVLIYVGNVTDVAVFSATWRLVCIEIMPAMDVSIAAITVIGATYGVKIGKCLKNHLTLHLRLHS